MNEVVELSRMQFGATALFHFLFVPLTLGLSWILFICLIMLFVKCLVFFFLQRKQV